MSKIPNKKHTRDELSRMRAQSAMQVNSSNQIVETYNKQLAGKFTVVLGYALPLITIGWWIIKKAKAGKADYFEMSDFWIMAVPLVLALVIALWIAIKRVLSRHNAAFISMLCALCCFPVFTAVADSSYLKADLFALIGKEIPVASDPLLDGSKTEDDLSSNRIVDSNVMTDAKRAELKSLEEEFNREKEEFMRKEERGDPKGDAEDQVMQQAIQKAKAVLAAKKKSEEAAAKALKQALKDIKAKSGDE